MCSKFKSTISHCADMLVHLLCVLATLVHKTVKQNYYIHKSPRRRRQYTVVETGNDLLWFYRNNITKITIKYLRRKVFSNYSRSIWMEISNQPGEFIKFGLTFRSCVSANGCGKRGWGSDPRFSQLTFWLQASVHSESQPSLPFPEPTLFTPASWLEGSLTKIRRISTQSHIKTGVATIFTWKYSRKCYSSLVCNAEYQITLIIQRLKILFWFNFEKVNQSGTWKGTRTSQHL